MTTNDTASMLSDALDALLTRIRKLGARGIAGLSSQTGANAVDTWRAGSGYTHLDRNCARISDRANLCRWRLDTISQRNPCADCAVLPDVVANHATNKVRLTNAIEKLCGLAAQTLMSGTGPDGRDVNRVRTTLRRLTSCDDNLETFRVEALALADVLDAYDGPTDHPVAAEVIRAAAIEVADLADGAHMHAVSVALCDARSWMAPRRIESLRATVTANYKNATEVGVEPTRVTGNDSRLLALAAAWVAAADDIVARSSATWLVAVATSVLTRAEFRTAAKWAMLRNVTGERGLSRCGHSSDWVMVTAPGVVVQHLSLTGIAEEAELYAAPLPDGCDSAVVARMVAGLWNPDAAGTTSSMSFADAVNAAHLLS